MLRVAVGLIVCDIVALGEFDTLEHALELGDLLDDPDALEQPLELEVIDDERLTVGDSVSLRVADELIVCEIVALGERDTLEQPLVLEDLLGDADTLEQPLELDVIDDERLPVGDSVRLRVAVGLIVSEIVALGE